MDFLRDVARRQRAPFGNAAGAPGRSRPRSRLPPVPDGRRPPVALPLDAHLVENAGELLGRPRPQPRLSPVPPGRRPRGFPVLAAHRAGARAAAFCLSPRRPAARPSAFRGSGVRSGPAPPKAPPSAREARGRWRARKGEAGRVAPGGPGAPQRLGSNGAGGNGRGATGTGRERPGGEARRSPLVGARAEGAGEG